MKKLTTEEFIEKSKKVHGDKYDYNLVKYINTKTKVKIACKKHGIFEQVPYTHLNKCGCPKCGRFKQIESQTSINFTNRSNKIHNSKYDYSKVEYINCKTKIDIICPIHGIFSQIPVHHIRCVGCSNCSKFYGGDFSEKHLYIFYDEKFNLMKIGVSKFPTKRLKMISKGKNKKGLKLLKIYEKCANIENHLHIKYDKYRTKHILYKDGSTEWFNLSKDEILNIDEFVKSQIKNKI